MFLIRSAILLVLIAIVLPSDPREQEKLYQTASHALHQAATFCDRNAALCTEAKAYLALVQAKLAVGARMAVDLVNERLAGAAPTPVSNMPTQRSLERSLPSMDTLRPTDRDPEWRSRSRTTL
jgi:hypothetical protein